MPKARRSLRLQRCRWLPIVVLVLVLVLALVAVLVLEQVLVAVLVLVLVLVVMVQIQRAAIKKKNAALHRARAVTTSSPAERVPKARRSLRLQHCRRLRVSSYVCFGVCVNAIQQYLIITSQLQHLFSHALDLCT